MAGAETSMQLDTASYQHTVQPSFQFNTDPSNQHTYPNSQFNTDPSNQHIYPSIQFNMDPGYQHAYPNTMDQIGVMPEDGANSGYHGNYNQGYQDGCAVWSVSAPQNTCQPALQWVQPGFDGQPPAAAAVYQDNRETVPIPNYVPCSIFTTVFCCFLLGAAGLYYAVTAKRVNQERKFLKARKIATRSCQLNVAAILIGLACYGVIIYVVYTRIMKASGFKM